ncbi:SGNH/GDSL hydrolase family protein [Pseudonocardia sp. EV170527-09]|nr:SGNH/GDSL hydrolase family protein [Pseudonocardia sp. EV170527-09]
MLGDSTAVGLGDPLPGGGWRGVGPLLRDALDDPARPGSVRLDNHARTGARMADARHGQVPVAAASGPDVVVLCVGMNDTLRSDFDPAGIRRDCAESLELLLGAGATVLLLRFHDHTRVWPLPGLLQRALAARISALNGAVDGAVADAVAATGRSAVGILDLDTAGSYDPAAWSVDRLHPSELGHRLLARGFAGLLGAAGFAVPGEVGLDAAGGREVTAWQRGAWLVVQGVPWLVRRGRDLGPVMVRGLVEGARVRRVSA